MSPLVRQHADLLKHNSALSYAMTFDGKLNTQRNKQNKMEGKNTKTQQDKQRNKHGKKKKESRKETTTTTTTTTTSTTATLQHTDTVRQRAWDPDPGLWGADGATVCVDGDVPACLAQHVAQPASVPQVARHTSVLRGRQGRAGVLWDHRHHH